MTSLQAIVLHALISLTRFCSLPLVIMIIVPVLKVRDNVFLLFVLMSVY